MGRKRKEKPPIVATCHLCESFFHSKLLKNDQVHNPRLCSTENREMLSTDPICEHFIPAKYFYCDRTTHQVSFPMCHQRKQRGMEECRKCKQFEQVLVAEATAGIPIPTPVTKPTPLKIRAIREIDEEQAPPEKQKVTLKKRVMVTLWEKPSWD